MGGSFRNASGETGKACSTRCLVTFPPLVDASRLCARQNGRFRKLGEFAGGNGLKFCLASRGFVSARGQIVRAKCGNWLPRRELLSIMLQVFRPAHRKPRTPRN